MCLAFLSSDLFSILAAIVLLLGVPAFVVVVLAVVSGYIRYDAEQRLDALAEDEGESEDRESRGDDP